MRINEIVESGEFKNLLYLDDSSEEGRDSRDLIINTLSKLGIRIRKGTLNGWILDNQNHIEDTIDTIIEKLFNEVRESDIEEEDQLYIENIAVMNIPNYIRTVILENQKVVPKKRDKEKRIYNRIYNFFAK